MGVILLCSQLFYSQYTFTLQALLFFRLIIYIIDFMRNIIKTDIKSGNISSVRSWGLFY